jgi:hypothetical protein
MAVDLFVLAKPMTPLIWKAVIRSKSEKSMVLTLALENYCIGWYFLENLRIICG